MASRENQGLQIALILFVMITVALGVSTYVFWDKSKKVLADKKDAEAETAKANKITRMRDLETQFLKATIGYSELPKEQVEAAINELINAGDALEASTTTIRTDFDKDMAKFDKSWGKEKNWRTLHESLQDVIRDRNATIASLREDEKKAVAKKDSDVANFTVQASEAKAGQQKAVTDLADARTQHAEEVRNHNESTEGLRVSITQANQNTKKVEDDLTAKIKERDVRIGTLEQANAALVETIKKLRGEDLAAVPDGEITWVNQGEQSVWVDLGIADGLHRQVTFSVYEKNVSNLNDAKPKGKIEVTRIIDRHLAEARIMSDDLSNPILRGDKIYTPTWVAGRTLKFAMAGFIDYNGDGKSDRELVKNLIHINGGEVVAEVTAGGEYRGTMELDTRYLILGERPTAKSNPELIANFGTMKTQAEETGVEVMKVDRLLEYMGFKSEAKTTPLGKRAGSGSGDFRKRYPTPDRGDDGAF